MNMELIIAVVIGVVVGWFVGRRSSSAAAAFTPQDGEPKSEAHLALQERTAKRHARIMKKAQTEGRIANDGVEDLFCISDRTASVYLGQLVDAGKLTRHGAGRGTYYTPNYEE